MKYFNNFKRLSCKTFLIKDKKIRYCGNLIDFFYLLKPVLENYYINLYIDKERKVLIRDFDKFGDINFVNKLNQKLKKLSKENKIETGCLGSDNIIIKNNNEYIVDEESFIALILEKNNSVFNNNFVEALINNSGLFKNMVDKMSDEAKQEKIGKILNGVNVEI